MGLVVDDGPTSKLQEVFDEIKEKSGKGKKKKTGEEEEDYEEEDSGDNKKENKDVQALYKKQLEYYLLMTSSCKEKLKVWNFEDGKSKMLTQSPCIGGSLGGNLVFMMSKAKELVVLSCGNVSNKFELYTM